MATSSRKQRGAGAKQQLSAAKPTTSGRPRCGLIMPISAIDNCTADHWIDVREILEASISEAGFDPQLVSDSDDSGIIQNRIIQNIYTDPILVCDVSGKNPNVMFELGMRLAFDRPTIIVKDEKTDYSFDTAPIEHLAYPRDLHYAQIVEFRKTLQDKVRGTYEKAMKDKDYTTFLKHFGTFSVAKLEAGTKKLEDYVLEEIQSLKSILLRRPLGSRDAQMSLFDGPSEPRENRSLYVRQLVDRVVRNPKFRRQMPGRVLVSFICDEGERTSNPAAFFTTRMEFESAVESRLLKLGLLH